MKKIFSFVMGLLAMTTLQAANTEVARLTLTGQGGTESSNVTLRVDPAVSTAQTTSFFGATDEIGQVNIYAIEGTATYSAYKKDDLSNLELQIITNRRDAADQHYTLTFNVPTLTDGLTLFDRATATTTPITHNGTYEFDVNTTLHPDFVAGTNYTVKERFYINYVAPTYETSVTTNAYGWASFSYASDVEPLDNSLKVYKGAISGETLNLTEVDYVKAAQGVMIYGEPSTTYYFALGNGSADFTGNAIKPSSAWASHTGTIYCLKGDALYQYTGTEMPANKAYIQIGGSSAPQRIRMVINGAQGIEDVEAAVKAEKFVENGQIFIRRGEHVYDLQGQIVK